MSEARGARPNLEWYRKSAKKTLAQLRADNPGAKLADAQRAVARQHGFSSWRQLKARIESMRGDVSRLLSAAADGDLKTVRAILQAAPSLLNAKDERGMTPLHAVVCANFKPLTKGHLDLLEHLLRLGPNLEALADEGNIGLCTPLHLAAFSGADRVSLVRLLLDHGANARVVGSQGTTPLFDAVRHGANGIAEALLAAGATPTIFEAVGLDRADLVERMLGADPEAASRIHPYTNSTPWAFARSGRMRELLTSRGSKPTIQEAAELGWIDEVRRQLDADPALINARSDKGQTPLHHAIDWNRVETVRLLLARGADRDAPWTPGPGWTAMELAEQRNWPEMIELLRSHKPSTSTDFDPRTAAKKLVRAMERAHFESPAYIERWSGDAGQSPRWEPFGPQSPTLREREADAAIIEADKTGTYRMISIWAHARVDQEHRVSSVENFVPTRALEFFRGDDPAKHPRGGIWRALDWVPTRRHWAPGPGAWDDLAEALAYLRQTASSGEYRVVSLRRMLHARRETNRLKVIKKHSHGPNLM